jgi:hypothetical protein
MSRIKKLETYYQKQLTEKNIKDISVFIQFIVNADITKGKYARFLIESFLNDKFLEEDLMGGLESTVGQAVSLFEKHKSKLPVEQRSVFALDKETGEALYQSPGDLWNSIKQYQGESSGKELKKEEQEKIYRETEFIYKDEDTGFQIISPLTKESAKWWGRGTRWCTSADKNNMFEHYAGKAPLFILLMPASAGNAGNGNKLQLWRHENNIQFMDEADKQMDINNISNILHYFQDDFLSLIKYSSTNDDINYKYKRQEVHVYYQLKNKHISDIIQSLNNDQISKIQTLFLNFIDINKKYLEFSQYYTHILDAKIDELNQMIKDLNNTSSSKIINFVIKSLINIDDENVVFDILDNKYKSLEISICAINKSTLNIEHLPEKYKNNYFFERFNNKLRKEKYIIYRELLKNNYNIFPYILNVYKTRELCALAVKHNREILQYVPNKYKTLEICETAVKYNGNNIKHVPYKLKNEHLYNIAIANNPSLLENYPFNIDSNLIYKIINVQNVNEILPYIKNKNLIDEKIICKIFSLIKSSDYHLKLKVYNDIFNDKNSNFKNNEILHKMIFDIDINYILYFPKNDFFWRKLSQNIEKINLTTFFISDCRTNKENFIKLIDILKEHNIRPNIDLFSISDNIWNQLNYQEQLKEKISLEKKNIFSFNEYQHVNNF